MVARFDNRPKPETGGGDSTGGNRLPIVVDPGSDEYNTGIPGAANKDAVKFGYFTGLQGTADRYEATGSGRYQTDRDVNTIVFEAQKYLGNLRAQARVPNASAADKKAYKDFVAALRRYKGGDPFETTSGEDTAWATVLKDAADTGVNAVDLLWGGNGSGGGGGSNGGSGGGGGPFTNVTTALSNRQDTESYLNAALGEFLGREATDKEIARFQKALNKQETRNPTIDKGVSSGSGTTATRINGFSGQAQMAKEFAQSRTDYAETTAATTLMDIMESAISESGPTKALEGFIDDGRS